MAVSADGSTAVVGASGHANLKFKGAAYVFRDQGGKWTQTTKLTASDGAVGDYFGGSVALTADDSTAVVGAPSAKRSHIRTGSAYVFKL